MEQLPSKKRDSQSKFWLSLIEKLPPAGDPHTGDGAPNVAVVSGFAANAWVLLNTGAR